MPELPEVEVVKRSLESLICNLTIKDIKINEVNLRYKVKKLQINQIIGLKILKIERRSKYLLFYFSKNLIMLVHLGMTGKFFFINKNQIKKKTSFYYEIKNKRDNKHNHVIFIFKNKEKLIYNDVRKFGFIKFYKSNNFKQNSHLQNLGPEPLEFYFNFKYFKKYIKKRNKIIKNLLMDQKFVSGLGNIYVNEILFCSQIRPNRRICDLTDIEIKRVLNCTKKILRRAINLGGSSIKNFSNSKGKAGSFQQNFCVYGKMGKECSNTDCNKRIEKIIIGKRSSFFCNNCQK